MSRVTLPFQAYRLLREIRQNTCKQGLPGEIKILIDKFGSEYDRDFLSIVMGEAFMVGTYEMVTELSIYNIDVPDDAIMFAVKRGTEFDVKKINHTYDLISTTTVHSAIEFLAKRKRVCENRNESNVKCFVSDIEIFNALYRRADYLTLLECLDHHPWPEALDTVNRYHHGRNM